jgi:YesN/AraC family two-component response regulator
LFTPEQDHQFVSHLQAGNAEQVQIMLDRQFKRLVRKCASLRQYEEFTNDCIQKIRKMLHSMHGDEQKIENMASAVQSMERFFDPNHYEAVLHRLVSEVCNTIRTRKQTNDPIIEFALNYVRKHYHQDLTLDSVAKPLNITGGYLSTYFKEKTGKNFIDYVHEVRIREAKRMLLVTDLKIQDIAIRSGYPYLNSFNRIFKKMTGMSPREYRKFHARAENEQGA